MHSRKVRSGPPQGKIQVTTEALKAAAQAGQVIVIDYQTKDSNGLSQFAFVARGQTSAYPATRYMRVYASHPWDKLQQGTRNPLDATPIIQRLGNPTSLRITFTYGPTSASEIQLAFEAA